MSTPKEWWAENQDDAQSRVNELCDGEVVAMIDDLNNATTCETVTDYRANLEAALSALNGIKEEIDELLREVPK